MHVVRDDRPFDAVERSRIETVAHQSGQRVGMLRATAQTQLQASTDPLTGLYNRRSMENSVRQLVQDQVPFADAEAAHAVMDRVRLELLAAVSDGRTPSFTVCGRHRGREREQRLPDPARTRRRAVDGRKARWARPRVDAHAVDVHVNLHLEAGQGQAVCRALIRGTFDV